MTATASRYKPGDRMLFSLFWNYVKPHSWQLLGVIFGLLVGVGLATGAPLLINYVIEQIELGNVIEVSLLTQIIVAYIVVNIVAWFFGVIQFIFVAKLTARVIRDIRIDAFSSILENSVSFFDQQKSGDLTSRVINDTRELAESAQSIAYFFTSLFRLVLVIGVFFYFNVTLTLAIMSIFPVVIGFSLFLGSFERKVSENWRVKLAAVNSNFSEIMSKIQISKAFHREQENLSKFSEVNEATYRASIKRGFAIFIFWPITDLMKHGFTLLILAIGTLLVTQQNMPVATLILFLILSNYFYWPLITIANNYHRFQGAFASLDRITKVSKDPAAKEREDGKAVNALQGEIVFDHVNFAYLPDEPVLRDISFHVRAGQRVAIVGHTGAGKSTIASILMRFYSINSGAVYIDRNYIHDYHLQDYRQSVSMVSQKVLLFKGSVRDNLVIAKPKATDEEIWAVLDAVQAREFIEQGDGLDSIVEENGKNLSAGQRQMISFARVLLSDPQILILDEATSAVDLYTEAKIQDAIEVLLQGRTSVSIAHRLTTILKSDIIIVLDQGRLVQMGNHIELLEEEGPYAEMYELYLETQSAKYLETIKH